MTWEEILKRLDELVGVDLEDSDNLRGPIKKAVLTETSLTLECEWLATMRSLEVGWEVIFPPDVKPKIVLDRSRTTPVDIGEGMVRFEWAGNYMVIFSKHRGLDRSKVKGLT